MKPEICPRIDAGLLLRQTQEKSASGIASAGKFYERSGVAVLGHLEGEHNNLATAIVEDRYRLPARLVRMGLLANGHDIFSIRTRAGKARSAQNNCSQQESPDFQLNPHRISHPQSVIGRIRRSSNVWQALISSQLLLNGLDRGNTANQLRGEKIRKCKQGVNAAANLPVAP